MSDALAAFLPNNLEATPKAYIHDKAPLVCLVLYINLEFDDEKHRVEQINTMFRNYQHDDYMEQLVEIMQSDENASACYQAAIQAAQEGLIEKFDPDFDTDRFEDEGADIEKFYTVSFLAWAEQAGFKLPEYVMPDLDHKVEYYFQKKHDRDEDKKNFVKITKGEFDKRMSEPLWLMTDALLYALGYKNNQSEDRKAGFLRYNRRVEQIKKYAHDAEQTGELKLFHAGGFINLDDKDAEKQLEAAFFASKVRPKDFIKWALALPIDLPALKEYADDLVDDKASNQNVPPPAPESEENPFQITFSDVSGEVVLNGFFTIATPKTNGQNYRIIRYLVQNPNRFVTADELKEKALDGKDLDKRLTDFVAQINMNKDIGKLFFDTGKDSIRLNNPVTPERMAEKNVKRVRIKPA